MKRCDHGSLFLSVHLPEHFPVESTCCDDYMCLSSPFSGHPHVLSPRLGEWYFSLAVMHSKHTLSQI